MLLVPELFKELKLSEAEEITGGLSTTTKLPCRSYDLPIQTCKTGSKLATKKGTICSSCYGNAGWYPKSRVQKNLWARFRQLKNPLWVDAMILLIEHQSPDYFRWHDIGDVQGLWHLQNIFDVCLGTPDTKHWMPTHEHGIIQHALQKGGMIKPSNLTIQLSANEMDIIPHELITLARELGCTVSGVSNDGNYSCPAPGQWGTCGACRKCWDETIFITTFKKHRSEQGRPKKNG